MKTKSLVFLMFAGLFAAFLYPLQTQLRHSSTATEFEDLKYLPSGKFLKGAALSFDEVAADLLWIKAIGYFGTHAQTDQDYTWLYHILDIVITLDPFFSDPYEFGGVVLSTELGDIEKSTEILKKGIANLPKHNKRYWYLPFYTAFNYMYYYGDNLTAAKYLEIASRYPQAPPHIPLLVARLYANTDDPGLALPFLQEMLSRSDSDKLKESLQKRIKEIQVKQHILILSAASKRYNEQTGYSIENLDGLVSSGILEALPVEPFGGQYRIGKNGDIETTSQLESMELHNIVQPKKQQSEPLIFLQEPKND